MAKNYHVCKVSVHWTDMKKSRMRREVSGRTIMKVRVPDSVSNLFETAERIAEQRYKKRSPNRMINVGRTEVVSCDSSNAPKNQRTGIFRFNYKKK